MASPEPDLNDQAAAPELDADMPPSAVPDSVAAPPPGPAAPGAPRSRIVRVDTSLLHKELWLLKVPAAFSEMVAGAPLGVALGSLQEVGGGAAASTAPLPGVKPGLAKRKVRLNFTVDQTALDALPADVRARTPSRYRVTVEPETQCLAMSATPEAGLVLLGTATQSGTVVPDEADPAYRAHLAYRRARERAAAAGRHGGKLREETDDMLSRMDGGGATAVASFGPRGGSSSSAGGAAAAASAAAPSVPRGTSVLALFEVRAYWSLRDLAAATGKKEAEVRLELSDSCEYLRAGPRRGTYRLRESFRSAGSAPRDPDDGGAV